jgi:phosphoribosylamine-glycine ligase
VSDGLEKGIDIYYAGAKKQGDGRIVTDGGRVLTIASAGVTLKEARDRVYRNIQYVNFKGKHYRTDIAAREVN